MKSFTIAFAIAIAVAALLTPLVRRLAFRLGAVAEPGGRHIHKQAIPRLGGVGIFVAFFAPLLALFFVESSVAQVARLEARRVLGLAVGGALLCGVGVYDDVKGVRALHKLGFQLAGGCVAFAAGFRIDAVNLPLLGNLEMGVFALPVTLLWVVGIVNAVNLIDGLDGLAAGVVFFAGLTNFVVAYLSGSIFVALTMAALLGSVIGFLFYNFNPARIFMGDSGSYFLGYVLAVSSLMGGQQKTSTAVSLLVPVVALGVPIFDTLFAMGRRFLEKRSIFSPDRGHIHHRLLDMGITHRRAVLIIYGVSIVFTLSAIGISLGKSWQVGVAILVASGVLFGLVRFLGYFASVHRGSREKNRIRSRDVDGIRHALPSLAVALREARTDDAVFGELVEFCKRAAIEGVEVVWRASVAEAGGAPDSQREPVFRWVEAPRSIGKRIERVVATYTLGVEARARAEVRFEWISESADVSAQADILLQVAADETCRGFERTGSGLAPARASTAELAEMAEANEARTSRSSEPAFQGEGG